VARLKACPDEELEFSHRLLQPLWSVMPWRLSKSATPLQSALTKNVSVNPLQSAVTKTLDLKFRGMNSYKKGWGYPPVETPVKPSKTKTSGFRSRAVSPAWWLILPSAWRASACRKSPRPCSLAQSTSLAGFPLAAVCADGIYGERVWLSGGDFVGGRASPPDAPDRQLRGSAYVVYVLRVDLPTSAA